MIKIGSLVIALALIGVAARQASAGRLTAEERAMLREPARAEEEIAARIERVRVAASLVKPATTRKDAAEKAAQAQRVERTLAKAAGALMTRNYRAAHELTKRVEGMLPAEVLR